MKELFGPEHEEAIRMPGQHESYLAETRTHGGRAASRVDTGQER